MKSYKLDTGTDGYDDVLFGRSAEEVALEVLSFHELDAIPAHWSIEELPYSPAAVAVLQRVHARRQAESEESFPQRAIIDRLVEIALRVANATGEELDQLHLELDQLE